MIQFPYKTHDSPLGALARLFNISQAVHGCVGAAGEYRNGALVVPDFRRNPITAQAQGQEVVRAMAGQPTGA